MHQNHDIEHELPGLWQSAMFSCKARVFQMERMLRDAGGGPARQSSGLALQSAPVIGEIRSPLWSQASAAEFSLTAGKIQNLRVSAQALHGLEFPAGKTFSFWRQIGRTVKSRGYTAGRELREGCIIPSVGGGLCQLSGLLYGAALDAGFEIVERHAHSRRMPGSLAESGRDATVFWNYVDLRFRAAFDWRLEVEMTATELVVRIRAKHADTDAVSSLSDEATRRMGSQGEPQRAAPSGDCLTCHQTSCFRHPGAVAAHGASLGHSAFLLDARWPEFDAWCASHAHAGDHYFVPLDGGRWGKPAYNWTRPPGVRMNHATLVTLLRAWHQRRLPVQGASRQRALLAADESLAKAYASRLHPECRHLIVSQNLLPFLWQFGALGGRTFDVLMQRWPMAQLVAQLDDAASRYPGSPTLADFRPDQELMETESSALAAAGRIITPHRGIAAHFGARSILLEWQMPEFSAKETRVPSQKTRFFYPCSALGRKGVYELAAAMQGLDAQLDVLGRATEGDGLAPLQGLDWRHATLAEMSCASVVVMPAWIEHQPRLALRALAMGIPVIATVGCGLPEHPLLHTLARPDAGALRRELQKFVSSETDCAEQVLCLHAS